MRGAITMLVFLLGLIPGGVPPAAAQVARAVVGGGIGVAGGAMVTLSIVVARARFQGEYLESPDDLIHWQSAPMIVTPAVGAAFGLLSEEALVGSLLGTGGGLLVGAAAGATLGWLISGQPEWPWAGGVMGAGAGMTIGGLLFGIRGLVRSRRAGDSEPRPDTHVEFRVPL
jgi:hypothetical protein